MKTIEPPTDQTSKYEFLLQRAKEVPSPRTVVVYPCDESSLRGAVEAAEAALIEPVLVGPAEKSRKSPGSISSTSSRSKSSTRMRAKRLRQRVCS